MQVVASADPAQDNTPVASTVPPVAPATVVESEVCVGKRVLFYEVHYETPMEKRINL